MLALLLACSSVERNRIEPSFVHVDLATGSTLGTEAAPLPFSAVGSTFTATITTWNVDGEAYPFSGEMSLSVRPGRVSAPARITLVDGAWTGSVAVEAGFGPTRIWAADEDVTDGRSPSWSAGVSAPIWFQRPTIPEMQTTDNHESNQLEGEFAELRIGDREVVVSATDPAGFYVSDLGAAPGNFSGLYIYTFSKPPDEIVVGARLDELNGQNSEYLAATQLSFPTLHVVEGQRLSPSPAALITEAVACENNAMEAYEGSRVRVEAPVIPATFTADSTAFADYVAYGQWPLEVGACTVYAESTATVPDYYPPDHAGETLSHVEGMLKEVYGKWIFIVLDETDIGAGTRSRKGSP